jgi:hypothetical protein
VTLGGERERGGRSRRFEVDVDVELVDVDADRRTGVARGAGR